MSSTPGTASRTATTRQAEPAKETTTNGSRAGKDARQKGSRAEGDHEGARSAAESGDPRGDRPTRLRALALGPKPVRDLVANPGRRRGASFGTARAARTAAARSADIGRGAASKRPESRRTMARFEEPDADEPARGHGVAVEHDRGRRLRRDHLDAPHPSRVVPAALPAGPGSHVEKVWDFRPLAGRGAGHPMGSRRPFSFAEQTRGAR